jgi:hypothetical protein
MEVEYQLFYIATNWLVLDCYIYIKIKQQTEIVLMNLGKSEEAVQIFINIRHWKCVNWSVYLDSSKPHTEVSVQNKTGGVSTSVKDWKFVAVQLGFMKYATKMDSVPMTYAPGLNQIGSCIQKFKGEIQRYINSMVISLTWFHLFKIREIEM